MKPIILNTETDTQDFAVKIANDCKNDKRSLLIYLSGDLGAGKTTFTRYFIQAFGWEGKVKSPTYTLIETYNFQGLDIYHLDLYRISTPEEVNFLGLEEIYNNPDKIAIILVEWAEKAAGILPAPDINLKFDYSDNSTSARSIEIYYQSSSSP